MTELVNVEGTELSVKEYHGKMVVSFSDICNVHKCDRKRIVKHFERKRKHFLKDVDYFEITRKELNDMVSPNSKIMGNPYMRTYLFTETGYLMIVKCLDDDTAWNVQRTLVNAYFTVKNQQPTTAIEEKPVLPIETDWFCINRWKINFICGVYKLSTREYMHSLLLQIGKTYNFDNAKQEFMRCTGRLPKSNSEVITYFQELADTATKILNDDIEHYKEMWKKENDPD
jgi:hypothetical protein